jgi:CubicO group peptidase (beta-lactamase class C family)
MKPIRRSMLLLSAALLLPALAPQGIAPPSHLDKLRLLPPVLIKGEAGYSIDERMRHHKVEAVSVAVVKDFRIVWTEARGFADREARVPATTATLFQAGSISKPVAAAGVLRRVEKGELQLDRDVNEYLKSWRVPDNELTAKQKVTLARILSHSAGTTVHGFPGYEAGAPVPTVPQILDGLPPANTEAVRVDREPGTKFNYSGGGTTIAQLVQTDTTGRPFPDLLRELVLAPAGMTHSTYEQPLPPEKLDRAAAGYDANGAPIPGKRHTYPEMAAAGLWTTSEDLARFGIAVANSLRGEKGSLLSKEMASRMTTPFLSGGPAGLGLFVQKHGADVYFGHNGSDEGFQAILQMHRDKGYGAAIMANSDRGILLGEEILRGIAREYGWSGLVPEPVTPVKLAAADMKALAGRYQTNGDDAYTVTVRDGRIVGKRSLGDEFELLPVSRDELVRREHEIRYRVERSKGVVSAIETTFQDEKTLARRMPDGVRLPSDFLEEGNVAAARTAYIALYAENPEDPAIVEPRLNRLGYELAQRRDFDRAIAVLKVNNELRPESANTYDSLAEVTLMSGDRAKALEIYRKELEILPADTKTDPKLKERLRRIAEEKVKELEK